MVPVTYMQHKFRNKLFWQLHELFNINYMDILAMKTDNKQGHLSLGASSSACLQGDEHGCGKQIDLQKKIQVADG